MSYTLLDDAVDESPLYLRIARELRRNIRDGVYRTGDRLPTEEQLAQRFGVNRHTLRRSILMLSSEGLLRVDQGRGTFVSEAPIQYPIGERVRFGESLRAQGREPSYCLLRAVEIPADALLAEKMGIAIGDPVALTERLGLADEIAIKVASSYFPLKRFPDILTHLKQEGASISRIFAEIYRCDHRRKRTTLSAQGASPTDARLLGLGAASPVLVAEAINVDAENQVIEYGVTRFRSDRAELVIEPHPEPT